MRIISGIFLGLGITFFFGKIVALHNFYHCKRVAIPRGYQHHLFLLFIQFESLDRTLK